MAGRRILPAIGKAVVMANNNLMIRLALYGVNGHQVAVEQPAEVRAQVVAVAGFPEERLPADANVRRYATLDELLADPEVELVSLCSPQRSEQADDAIRCMEAGKHVLAEKPAALTDADLDRILATADRTGKRFHEMADTFLCPPVVAMRRLVNQGLLGTIVHVQTLKSYPWYEDRKQDLVTDGGLVRQVGVHAARFIIGATGQRIVSVQGVGTNVGNPGSGHIQVAASIACTLEQGAVATMDLNYCNPPFFGQWGNDQLRVFGTAGMAESVDGFTRNSAYLPDRDARDLPMPPVMPSMNYLMHFVDGLLDGTPMPIPYDMELAALRAVIAAQRAVETGERVTVQL